MYQQILIIIILIRLQVVILEMENEFEHALQQAMVYMDI
jgi:hypothetical protein